MAKREQLHYKPPDLDYCNHLHGLYENSDTLHVMKVDLNEVYIAQQQIISTNELGPYVS